MTDPAMQHTSVDRPLHRSTSDGGRWRAYLLKTFADHGIFRLAYRNWHTVAPGMYRSNQPYPFQLARAARDGVRTVINLRGYGTSSFNNLEREACEKLGVTLIEFPVASRALPTRETVLCAGRLFETITYPALMHCKSGSDRVGLMSALYLLMHENRPPHEAARQLSLRYGHFRSARTGILDVFVEEYRAAHSETGIGFEEWVTNEYDEAAIQNRLNDSTWANIIVDHVLRRT